MKVELIESSLTHNLRHLVLWPHIENEEDCIIDIDQHEDAIHIGAFLEANIIGVCSLFKMKSPRLEYPSQYRLRVMATHPGHRDKGVGKIIVKKALVEVQKRGVDVLWCDARKVALSFYEKMGFVSIGDWYGVPNIGKHKTMYRLM